MLSIQIDNPELERCIHERFGGNPDLVAQAFSDFLRQDQIRHDVKVSIDQLEAGEGIPMKAVMQEIRQKF